MTEQVFWDDVAAGQEIPRLVKRVTPRQLVKWAAASGDYYEVHYNQDFATKAGLPGIIVHGWLTLSFLAQMLTDWVGEYGEVRKLSVNYRRMNFPGEDIICRGKVVAKQVRQGEHQVELDIWAERANGERTTPGKAVVALPSRVSPAPGSSPATGRG